MGVRYRPFNQAKEFVHSLKLKNINEWQQYCKSSKKPDDIPSEPKSVYKSEFKGIGDWLGTGFVATQERQYRSFHEARKFVHSLGLSGLREWKQYCKSGKKPDDIPSNCNITYKKYWKAFGDWLGTGTVAPRNKQF